MHVSFVLSRQLQRRNGVLFSEHPSLRYRLLAFLEELRSISGSVALVEPDAKGKLSLERSDVTVITKINREMKEEVLRVAALPSSKRGKLVLDICDNMFVRDDFDFYHELVGVSDLVTCASEMLMDLVIRIGAKRAVVLPEPYEGPEGIAAFGTSDSVTKLLWYGTAKKARPLYNLLPEIDEAKLLVDVTVLSEMHPKLHSMTRKWAPNQGRNVTARLNRWSLTAVWAGLAATDIVALPSPQDELHDGRSPNRLIEAINAGRAVVANNVGSYREFAEYVVLTDNVVEGLIEIRSDPNRIPERLRAGQAYVRSRFSPEVVARAWHEALANA